MLAEVAAEHGSQTAAIRQGIRLLADESLRRRALRSLLDDWAEEAGPPDPDEIAAMRRRYFDR